MLIEGIKRNIGREYTSKSPFIKKNELKKSHQSASNIYFYHLLLGKTSKI